MCKGTALTVGLSTTPPADFSAAERFNGVADAIVILNYCHLCQVLKADRTKAKQKFVLIGWLAQDFGARLLCTIFFHNQ